MRLVRAAVRAALRRLHAVHAVPRPTRATRPGATTSSSAATERGAMAPDARRPSSPFPATAALDALASLWEAGHAATWSAAASATRSSVGRATDWDLATAAHPEQVARAVPGRQVPEPLRHGGARSARDRPIEITTFRRDQHYADHRRPDGSTFTDDVVEDLARRDFTVNAIAWGGRRPAATRGASSDWPSDRALRTGYVDPTSGERTLTPASCAPSANRARASTRMPCGMLRAARLAARSASRSSRRRSPQ